MTTANQIRALVVTCVDEAIKEVPHDVNFRARCFAAFLTAALSSYAEDGMSKALRKLLTPDQARSRSSTTAGAR